MAALVKGRAYYTMLRESLSADNVKTTFSAINIQDVVRYLRAGKHVPPAVRKSLEPLCMAVNLTYYAANGYEPLWDMRAIQDKNSGEVELHTIIDGVDINLNKRWTR